MATFITSKPVEIKGGPGIIGSVSRVTITVSTTTGFWKYIHNGTTSLILNSDEIYSLPVLNANGEFTIISWDDERGGQEWGDITAINLNSPTDRGSLISNGIIAFDGTGLSSLNELRLNDNQLTTLDLDPLVSLRGLSVSRNPLINTSAFNDLFLEKLAANELANEWGGGEFFTSGYRTSAGTTDYNYLIGAGWTIGGARLPGAKLGIKGTNQ